MDAITFYTPEVRRSGPYSGLPVFGLVCDEISGVRWLITDGPVPVGAWRLAVQSGAVGIVTPHRRYLADEVALLRESDGIIYLDPQDRLAGAVRSQRQYVHLHAHSEYSPLDGLSRIDEMVAAIKADGQDAMAITDHGVCAGHLELQKVARKEGIKPIFGIEANFVDEARRKEKADLKSYWHFILLAKTQKGLHNLWRASTLANSPDRFYGRPRMDWSVLEECAEGLVATTACLRGVLSDLIIAGDEAGAKQTVARLRSMFRDDLYLELHTNSVPNQRIVNQGLVSIAHDLSLPLIVVDDSHYACTGDKDAHQVWIKAQTNSTLQDEGDLFRDDSDYHLHTADEAMQAISYLGEAVAAEAVANTALIASQCDVTAKGHGATPVYHRKEMAHSVEQGVALDFKMMGEICEAAWASRVPEEALLGGPLYAQYRERYEHEMSEFSSKKFCGYQLIVWDYANWCRDNRVLMGPGRGSAAGSLVCFLMGITQIDPIEADLIFERFISPGRTSLPDIDSDFPASKRDAITQYIVDRWGSDHAVRVGTVTRLRNKGVFNEVAKVFKGSDREVPWQTQEEVKKIITSAEQGTAGLGLKWDDLIAQVGDELAPYEEANPDWFRFAKALVGRLKSYGKHPAGVVIDPMESIVDWLPLRQGEDEAHPVTEFPMDQLDELGFVKFDILTVRTLDTIQETMDLIEADPRIAGRVPHPHTWREEYKDPLVWDEICAGRTLGMFQIETADGTKLSLQFQPRSIADLCAIGSLVRPGPKNSGLTATYMRRRNGEEAVVFQHPLLESVLSRTYACMIYQEDIMNVCSVIGGYTSGEADEVRSILGKKKVDKIAAEGQRFVTRSIANGISQDVAEGLFKQMEEFAKYSFNKSHSWAYATLTYWCAWFKTHFPAQFLVACLRTAEKDRFPEYVMDARHRGYTTYLPNVNLSGIAFGVSEDGLGVRYGLSSIKGFGEKAAADVIAGAPYSSWDDFIERRGKACNWGHIKLLAGIGALDDLIPEGHSRPDLIAVCDQMSEGKLEQCSHLLPGCAPAMGVNVCCGFSWGSEPPVLGKSGKPVKAKPIPAKCTRACRQYNPVSAIHWPHETPPTPLEIRRTEREVLGLYVSSTPFDSLNLEGVPTIESMSAPGYYSVVGEVKSVRERSDKFGRKFAFITITLPDGSIDTACFSRGWEALRQFVRPDVFGLFNVERTTRGFTLTQFVPIKQE